MKLDIAVAGCTSGETKIDKGGLAFALCVQCSLDSQKKICRSCILKKNSAGVRTDDLCVYHKSMVNFHRVGGGCGWETESRIRS
jgi:hypothetical protein